MTALLRHGEVGYSDIERLEVLRSARNTGHYRRLSAMLAALPKIRVLHYDHDYDLIASITAQDAAWVVEQGSVS